MKIEISGDDMDKKDLIEVGKFLTNFFSNRKDKININITEGTEDMSKQECLDMIIDMFQDKKCFTTIYDKRNEAYKDR